jgi:hypothetical protein
MSGAAAIAAAKNRRGKETFSRFSEPAITCSTVNNKSSKPSQQVQNKTVSSTQPTTQSNLDQENLRILGPMNPIQIIQIHEKRMNLIDEKIKNMNTNNDSNNEPQIIDNANADRIQVLEEKIYIMEQVIMNLQLTLTNVQNFAIETNLELSKNKASQAQMLNSPATKETLPTTEENLPTSEETLPTTEETLPTTEETLPTTEETLPN